MPNCESGAITQRDQHLGQKASEDPNRLAGGPSGTRRVVESQSIQLVEAEDNVGGIDIAFQQYQHLNVSGSGQLRNQGL